MKVGQKVTVKNEGVHPEDRMYGEWYIVTICETDIGISRLREPDDFDPDYAEWFVNKRRIEVCQ